MTDTSTIKVKLNSNEIYETDNPRSINFKEDLLKKGVKISENSPMTPKEVIPYPFGSFCYFYSFYRVKGLYYFQK